MNHHDHSHDHAHEHDSNETYGIALGFRIIEDGGELFLVEAEISPYVDEPDELGATIVFHPLAGVNPAEPGEVDWPSWAIDFDDQLTRDPTDSIEGQFAAITRQLRDLGEEQLRSLLREAKEQTE